jgi:hypothetical protein
MLNPCNWRSTLIDNTKTIVVAAIAASHNLERGFAAGRANGTFSLRISTSHQLEREECKPRP